ncbi:MAG: DEAD/DEAH box helicase [Haloquadratum sp.]|nr:DEAD/DEAH box helicase [Haloferacaceae archaeon]MDR9445484.1 DEAD/DEAH box helicase [Haloquadratum sp.]
MTALAELPLPPRVLAHLRSAGITELYPPQERAVEAGLLRGANIVAAIPTASGKTLIAAMAMLSAPAPAVYIVPLRALAAEKSETFAAYPGVTVGMATGEQPAVEQDLQSCDIIVATAEKVDSAIRNAEAWVSQLGCVVVDEAHLLGDPQRGASLEMTITALRHGAPRLQVVALSATVANAETVAAWLDATLIASSWRPVHLRTGVVDVEAGTIGYDDGSRRQLSSPEALAGDDDAVVTQLVRRTVADGTQSLVFVRSREAAETLALRLAGLQLGERPELAEAITAEGRSRLGERLARAVAHDVGFHHAGLRRDHRRLIETAFRDRRLRVLCATPTLAAGINVPARQVIVRDLQRFDGREMQWLPVLEVHQMAGRAGRPHLDPEGEAVLVGLDQPREAVRSRYLGASPEPVRSHVATPITIETYVLAVVAAGLATTPQAVVDVFAASLYGMTTERAAVRAAVAAAVERLSDAGLLARGPPLVATPLGTTVARQYLRPRSAEQIITGARRISARAAADRSILGALDVLAQTPDLSRGWVGNRDRAMLTSFAERHAAELVTDPAEATDYEGWLAGVKQAYCLSAWVAGADQETLLERFQLSPGDLESLIERGVWLIGAAEQVLLQTDVELGPFGEVAGVVRERAAVPEVPPD